MRTHSTVRFAPSTLLTGVFAAFLSSALAAPLPVETEPTLNTSDFRGLPPLTGAGYRIEPTVPVSGYYGHFTLKTDLGTVDAEGIQLLHQRVNEVKAAPRDGTRLRAADEFRRDHVGHERRPRFEILGRRRAQDQPLSFYAQSVYAHRIRTR